MNSNQPKPEKMAEIPPADGTNYQILYCSELMKELCCGQKLLVTPETLPAMMIHDYYFAFTLHCKQCGEKFVRKLGYPAITGLNFVFVFPFKLLGRYSHEVKTKPQLQELLIILKSVSSDEEKKAKISETIIIV